MKGSPSEFREKLTIQTNRHKVIQTETMPKQIEKNWLHDP